jgi:GT2 family glycosyltransferase/predicted SAM-dependent methyltransferase
MLSIIIPIFNQHDMTHECITSIQENTQDFDSNPPFKPPFIGFNDINLIRNDENKGFPVAVNQGIREAKGEIIIVLNNDIIVTPQWSEKLISYLGEYSISGPLTNYCAGMQMVTIDSYENKDELNNAAQEWSEDNNEETIDVNWVIGFCMVFKKSLFDEIGPFDETLWPCCGEEIDFCLRAKKAGHKIGIAQDVYIHHEGSVTFKDMDNSKQLNYMEICERNDKHLMDKWGKDVYMQEPGQIPTQSEATREGIRLNLGSGYAPIPGFINIDNRPEVNPDLVCDVLEGLPYEDNSIDEIQAYDFLEHIPIGKTIQVITEIWRILKPDGHFESFTPDAEMGQGAFQDPTHVSFWVKNSWLYFSDLLSRKLYDIKANFNILSIERVKTGNHVYHLKVIAKAIKNLM